MYGDTYEAWDQADDDLQALADERDALLDALAYATGSRRAALKALLYEVRQDMNVLAMKLEYACAPPY